MTLKSVNTREVTGERELSRAHTPPRGPPLSSAACESWVRMEGVSSGGASRAAAGAQPNGLTRWPGAGTSPVC